MSALDPDAVLSYIKEFTIKRGYTPSINHIQNVYGVDYNTANRVIMRLVKRGSLARTERHGVFTIV